MTSLETLPFDPLLHICSYLYPNLLALRNCALTCTALLPPSRFHLFAVVDFSLLDNADAAPFFKYITTLSISEKSETLANNHGLHIDAALALPRLKALAFRGVAPRTMPFVTALLTRLPGFVSVTELSLYETQHASLEQPKAIISSLPNLSRLSIHAVALPVSTHHPVPDSTTLLRMVSRGLPPLEDGPHLSHLKVGLLLSVGNGTSAILDWLACTTTANTLTTLDVPAASIPYVVVNRFGPSIQHLSVGWIEDVLISAQAWSVEFMQRYSNLRSLELGGITRECWGGLFLLVAAISSPRLREITLRYRTGRHPDVAWAQDCAKIDTVDNALHSKLSALERVCFVVECKRCSEELGGEKREAMRERVKQSFHRLDRAGKLNVSFELV